MVIQIVHNQFKPEAVNWFVVGDKVKIISKLNELGFDDIVEIDEMLKNPDLSIEQIDELLDRRANLQNP